MSFTKSDNGKNMLELIEPKFIMELGMVLTSGAIKYDRNNWKNMSSNDRERIKGALLRHLYRYLDGQTHDDESMLHELAHVSCNAMFLMWYDMQQGDLKKMMWNDTQQGELK